MCSKFCLCEKRRRSLVRLSKDSQTWTEDRQRSLIQFDVLIYASGIEWLLASVATFVGLWIFLRFLWHIRCQSTLSLALQSDQVSDCPLVLSSITNFGFTSGLTSGFTSRASTGLQGTSKLLTNTMAKTGFMTRKDARELAELYHASAKDIVSANVLDVNWLDTDLVNAGRVTENDKFDMTRMGKKQEMRRVFRQFSILSFTCVIMATWEFLLTASSQGLVDGGLSGLFWSYIWVSFDHVRRLWRFADLADIYRLWSDHCIHGRNGKHGAYQRR